MTQTQLEKRTITELPTVETRSEDSGSNVIVGYAALFDVETNIGGWFTESVAKGAFTRALKEGDDTCCLFNHSTDNLLGRVKAGTLRLKEDDKGLWIENDMPDTQIGRDVLTSIKRGDVTGQSFAFIIEEQEWRFAKAKGEMDHRTIKSVVLYDVGPVAMPQYTSTSIAARSVEDAYKQARAEWEATERTEEVITIVTKPLSPYLLKIRCLRASR